MDQEPHANNINGIADNFQELSITDRKPIVTYAGDKELFLSLESTLVSWLPQEPTEWGRSYGRAVKTVHVAATFLPFTKEVLPKEGDYRLIEQPVLHTYWTQCSDVETYKTTVREDIELWMRVLVQYNLTDWMIVLVETYDFRKTNKLIPRTTVLDKIRGDFGAKHADRCLSVINPLRSESRSAGSWRGLIVNFRLLLLTAYDRALLRFEEFIREQRERRNQPGWSFTRYFLLQEELAFVLEMLGVYEEALIQYDELDALFTQFVLNSHLGESPSWLSQFCVPLESWAGLTLRPRINTKERARIQTNTMSLLQFRNYLFSRQCAMLLCAKKPWEVAERTLPFLHNTIRELSLLEVGTSPGTVSCWVFLSCLEVLHTCETFTDRALIEQYSVFTAGLWAYARQKLAELGDLCGLMPGKKPTSEQLHLVVEISSGLDESSTSTVEKLKQALSSQQAFCKQYLELSELAMGTYKHIGRIRCARSIGCDLAKFYRTTGDHSTAILFLQNALHCYEQDGWKQLAVATKLQLAICYLEISDYHRYVKMCASIASSPNLNMQSRMWHYEEMVKILSQSVQDPPWTGPLSDCMTLTDIDIQVDRGSTSVSVILGLNFGLPVATRCPSIAVSIVALKQHDSKQHLKHKDSLSGKRKNKEDLMPVNPLLQRLAVFSRLDYQQDKSLAGANVDIKNQKNLLKRQDSHGKYRKISSVSRSDFSKVLSATDVTLQPGRNTVTLTSKENEPGNYRLGQLSVLLLGKLDLLSTLTTHKLHFEVTKTPPTVALNTMHGNLLAGIRQTLSVDINSGGHRIQQGSTLTLKTSSGLSIQLEESDQPLKQFLEVMIPDTEPNTAVHIPLTMLAQLPSLRDSTSIEHTVTIKSPWTEERDVTLSMQPALTSSVKLHTAKLFKYLHITVTGNAQQRLVVSSPSMRVIGPLTTQLVPANPTNLPVVISNDKKVGYMWKLKKDENADCIPVKTEFTLHYHPMSETNSQPTLSYKCTFEINNYKTMYIVESKVEPVRGCEFCRVSTVCQLVVKVTRVNTTQDTSLMYEVLAEHNMWAICGRTAGVLSLDSVEVQTVSLDVMPLINGYLPLPMVRLSKYIPANTKMSSGNNMRGDLHPRLEPFNTGEVYYVSKGTQVHVIAAVSPQDS